MDRRGFLARLTAAAAGMAAAAQSGGIVVAAPQKAMPVVAPIRSRRLSDAQQQVIDILRECRVVGVGRTGGCLDGPTRYTITYRQRAAVGLDDGDEPLPYCNLSHHQILDVGSPLSITANYIGSMVDVSHLGQPWRPASYEPVLEVEVIWYLP